MLKLTFCLRRKSGLSREDFLRYWKDQHGPRVDGHLKTLGCRKYLQFHTLEGDLATIVAKSRGGPEPFDGVAELWFDDEASFLAHGKTKLGKEAAKDLLKDELTFIDLENSVIFLSEQQLVIVPK